MTTQSPNDSMRWLLWKDYRANRPILWIALFLLMTPYVVAGAVTVWRPQHGPPAGMFIVAGLYSIILVQLVFAVFGGNAIAGERADRSAEFLGALPISRRRKLASKLWFGLGLWTMAWTPNLLVMAAIWFSLGERVPPVSSADFWAVPLAIAVTGLTFFCVAWMFSAMLESPTFAAGAGLVTPLLVGMCCFWGNELTYYLGRDRGIDDPFVFVGYVGTCLLISVVSFLVGTRYYLRRVEP